MAYSTRAASAARTTRPPSMISVAFTIFFIAYSLFVISLELIQHERRDTPPRSFRILQAAHPCPLAHADARRALPEGMRLVRVRAGRWGFLQAGPFLVRRCATLLCRQQCVRCEPIAPYLRALTP